MHTRSYNVAPRVTGRKFGGQSFPVKCVSFGSAKSVVRNACARIRIGKREKIPDWLLIASARFSFRPLGYIPITAVDGRGERWEKNLKLQSRDVGRLSSRRHVTRCCWPYPTRIVLRFCDVQTSPRQRPAKLNSYLPIELCVPAARSGVIRCDGVILLCYYHIIICISFGTYDQKCFSHSVCEIYIPPTLLNLFGNHIYIHIYSGWVRSI